MKIEILPQRKSHRALLFGVLDSSSSLWYFVFPFSHQTKLMIIKSQRQWMNTTASSSQHELAIYKTNDWKWTSDPWFYFLKVQSVFFLVVLHASSSSAACYLYTFSLSARWVLFFRWKRFENHETWMDLSNTEQREKEKWKAEINFRSRLEFSSRRNNLKR